MAFPDAQLVSSHTAELSPMHIVRNAWLSVENMFCVCQCPLSSVGHDLCASRRTPRPGLSATTDANHATPEPPAWRRSRRADTVRVLRTRGSATSSLWQSHRARLPEQLGGTGRGARHRRQRGNPRQSSYVLFPTRSPSSSSPDQRQVALNRRPTL